MSKETDQGKTIRGDCLSKWAWECIRCIQKHEKRVFVTDRFVFVKPRHPSKVLLEQFCEDCFTEMHWRWQTGFIRCRISEDDPFGVKRAKYEHYIELFPVRFYTEADSYGADCWKYCSPEMKIKKRYVESDKPVTKSGLVPLNFFVKPYHVIDIDATAEKEAWCKLEVVGKAEKKKG